jgi:hypothetical protein
MEATVVVNLAAPSAVRERRAAYLAAGFAVAACPAVPTPADAQIYSTRDAGTLILSDRPLGTDAKTHAVRTRFTCGRPTRAGSAAHESMRNDHRRALCIAGRAPDPCARSFRSSQFQSLRTIAEGRLGLMQLMPATAAELGVLNPFNVIENIRGGVAYLRRPRQVSSNEELALAACAGRRRSRATARRSAMRETQR